MQYTHQIQAPENFTPIHNYEILNLTPSEFSYKDGTDTLKHKTQTNLTQRIVNQDISITCFTRKCSTQVVQVSHYAVKVAVANEDVKEPANPQLVIRRLNND